MKGLETEAEREEAVRKYFPEPYQTSNDYKEVIEKIIQPVFELLPKNREEDRAFLGTDPRLTIDFENVHKAKLQNEGQSYDEVMKEVADMFQGLPNFGSSLSMMNVVPQSNKIALSSFLFTAMYSPNILEGEYAWNVHKAELEAGAMLGDMAWDEGEKSGCVFTYGGEAGWTYALQYGKSRVLKDSMRTGIWGRVPGKVICSKVAQFSKQHSSVWSGIGTDNLIQIPVDTYNRMDMKELEKVLKDLHEKDIPVLVVACTIGTTDANAIDPVKEVYELLQKYPNNPKKYGKAVIYADAVIGFSWLAYKGYDWEKNPLGFGKEALAIIKENYARVEQVKYADCYTTDFHKSGFCPYVATSFNYKDADDFEGCMSYDATQKTTNEDKAKYAYLQERSPYNPMNYTLESSRGATGSVAAWATMKYFGKDGFRLIMGWEVEKHMWIRKFIEQNKNMICVNPDNHGEVTLFRVYDKGVNAKEQYEKELNDPNALPELMKSNKMIKEVGEVLWRWYRTGHKIDGKYTPYTSYSTGFRATNYNLDWHNQDAVVYCLKSYPMQVHSTAETFDWVVKCVEMAMEEAKKSL